MDRREVAANGRVAHVSLRGQVEAAEFVAGDWARVSVALTDLLDAPGGRRERQVLYGQRVLVLERRAGFAFGILERDGYVGYLAEADLGPDMAVTHWVCAPATHLYGAADIKQPEVLTLSLGAQVAVAEQVSARFVRLQTGLYAIAGHLRALEDWASDPVEVAMGFVGTPYLWGGNSRGGMDCSGLVQAAHLACGIACPGDSDQQGRVLGAPLADGEALRRGDLLFWRGHVALCVDADRLIHAVGHFMDVRVEPVAAVIARNLALGAGPVTGRRRVAAGRV